MYPAGFGKVGTINALAFVPMLGSSTAVNTMVGQALGDNNPTLAERSTFSAASLTLTFITVYICVLAVIFLMRFLGGKWKTMRVIEHIPPIVAAHRPDTPMLEA